MATMPTEDEKRAAVYECLRASKKPMEIVRFLGYKKSTVYAIKKNGLMRKWRRMGVL